MSDGQQGVYLHDWEDDGEAGMLRDFGIDKSALEGATVIVASYTYECYSGQAFVLFERNGKLFEVNGGHCSCYGLSESDYSGDTTTQWQPEETSFDALLQRIPSSYDPGVHAFIYAAARATSGIGA
ncbi:hypothetical protein [Shinella sp. JR1-6]|uniref:hypothetical protein n=1 Tax=Shinella sp. JR1-6 TaxID=2527671 RepID=UPI0014046D21|nr:hypothetical protein [Shinella sp. JR1-6]